MLKHVNNRKYATSFIDTRTIKAVRVASLPKKPDQPTDMNELCDMILKAPEEEIFRIEHVSVQILPEDMPGFPTRIET